MHTAVNGMLRDVYRYNLDGQRVNSKANENKMSRVPKETKNTDEGEPGRDVPESQGCMKRSCNERNLRWRHWGMQAKRSKTSDL